MMEILLRTILRAKVSINGRMAVCTRGTGLIIRCMASAHSLGQTAEGTKGHTIMTKKRDWARSSGLIKEFTKEVGWMGNSMGSGIILLDLICQRGKENGKKEKGSGGSIKRLHLILRSIKMKISP